MCTCRVVLYFGRQKPFHSTVNDLATDRNGSLLDDVEQDKAWGTFAFPSVRDKFVSSCYGLLLLSHCSCRKGRVWEVYCVCVSSVCVLD